MVTPIEMIVAVEHHGTFAGRDIHGYVMDYEQVCETCAQICVDNGYYIRWPDFRFTIYHYNDEPVSNKSLQTLQTLLGWQLRSQQDIR